MSLTRGKYWAFCESAVFVTGADARYFLVAYKYSSNHKTRWIMFSELFYFLCYNLDLSHGTDLFKFAIYAVLSFENGTGHTQGIVAGIYNRLRYLGTAFVYLSSCSRIEHFNRVLIIVISKREQKLSVTGDSVEQKV
jgi:hypothetical protein